MFSELKTELRELNKHLARANSAPRLFLLGIIRGAGAAVGATIILGLAITLLATLIQSVENIPIINELIESLKISDLIEQLQTASPRS